jgi:putative flippase GtrA
LATAIPWRTLGRWWIVGLVFLGAGFGFLYFFKQVLGLPLVLATLFAAEVTTVTRFAINDMWVFGNRRPTWGRLWQFHAASAGGAAIWLVVANVLPRFGVHYLLASALGSALSVLLSMATNFLWIWRKRVHGSPAVEMAESAKVSSTE